MATNQATRGPTHTGVVDVSDLSAARLLRYAREAGDVYLERKGGRTFLVADR